MTDPFEQAADAIASAKALLICAGAGMGVDSGLPDFRGPEGFWRAYPAYKHLGLSFTNLANPQWFSRDPALAWGFYGHRMHLYRETVPHAGFGLIRKWARDKPSFVFTSNVDGQFQKAGWAEEDVFEVHGSIHWLQCSEPCGDAIWSAEGTDIDVDPEAFRARGELAACPSCQRAARPNILMFGDWGFVGDRAEAQQHLYDAWRRKWSGGGLAVIEMGAGSAIPTVRMNAERHMRDGARLIRINPRESQGPLGTISLPTGAQEALERIDQHLAQGA